MNFSSFDLEKTSSPNWMGLTATVGGERALIVGWDGNTYSLETETGRRLKTADFIWEHESLADEDVMEGNARVAALRADDSPYKTFGRLSFDHETGEWNGTYLGESLTKLADDLEQLSDDEFGGEDEPEQEDEQALLKELEDFLQNLPGLEDTTDANGESADKGLLDTFYVLLECAADPEKDIAESSVDISSLLGDEERIVASVKTSIGPLAVAIPALASRLLPFASKGLQMQGLNSLLGGGQQQVAQQPIQVQRPAEYGLQYQGSALYSDSDTGNAFGLTTRVGASGGTELIDAMRSQVDAVLKAIAPLVQEIQFDSNALWYVLYDSMTNADSISQLQSILQSIPEEYHNVSAGTPPIEDGAADPMTLPSATPGSKMVPGGSIPPEGPAAPGLNPTDTSLTPGGPGPTLPPGSAPGGGIPGGPGRRAPMPRGGSVVTSTPSPGGKVCPKCGSANTLKYGHGLECQDCGNFQKSAQVADEFEAELLSKSSIYEPLGQQSEMTPTVTFGQGADTAQERLQLDQLVQQLINQGMPAAQAYGQAALQFQNGGDDSTYTTPLGAPQSPSGVTQYAPTAPQVLGAANSTGELPVMQDGRARANLKCPKCSSQTIRYAGEEHFVCSTCGHEFGHNIKEDKTSSLKWADTNGDSLEVGKMYKMHIPGVPVPDFIRVTWVEPENIRVAFTVSGQEDEVKDHGYEFEPIEEDAGIESGLSWIMEGSSTNEPIIDPELLKSAGRSYTQQEQRSFVDEEGEARNMDRLNLEGTHYRSSGYEDIVNIQPSNPNRVDPNQFLIG